MRVEIYGDVLCPWCYIGKRRLETARAAMANDERLEFIWRSYELDPTMGRVPGPTAAEAMVGWWGAQASARVERIRALGAAEHLNLDLYAARPVNTFDAHRLCQLATDRGRADQMMERLLYAYHTEGLNIADREILFRLGVGVGLVDGEVRDLLSGDAYAEAVRADRRRATTRGVTGVPTLVINGGAPVPAVQAPAELRRLLEQALAGSYAVPGSTSES